MILEQSSTMIKKICLMVLMLTLSFNTWAQELKAINTIIPNDITDARSKISKQVMGIGASVNVSINLGLKDFDACSDGDYGHLSIEIMWYNLSDETGKMLFGMMKDLKTVEQDKTNFLKGIEGAKMTSFSKGSMLVKSSVKECVNEISGPTGKQQYSTEAKYFSFGDTRTLKITLNGRIKPERAESIISSIQAEVTKFDFAPFSTIVSAE